jgi:hypothetical protein
MTDPNRYLKAAAASMGDAAIGGHDGDAEPVAPSRSVKLAHWFDSDLPSARLHALELWRGADGATVLWEYRRRAAGDVWPPPKCLGRNLTHEQAANAAEQRALDPYLVR